MDILTLDACRGEEVFVFYCSFVDLFFKSQSKYQLSFLDTFLACFSSLMHLQWLEGWFVSFILALFEAVAAQSKAS